MPWEIAITSLTRALKLTDADRDALLEAYRDLNRLRGLQGAVPLQQLGLDRQDDHALVFLQQ